MKEIAILITCFNRREKTLACLHDIYNSDKCEDINFDIFIVDGGSSDGTYESILQMYPQVHIKKHQDLYWAGGMRKAWELASNYKNYDYFLLLNDDTHLYSYSINELLKADQYSLSYYKKHGIYIGSTQNSKMTKITYGGRKLQKWGHLKNYIVFPKENTYQLCDLGNANIMLVTKEAYNIIGSFNQVYTHGIADYDYTLRARKANIPVLVLPTYLGTCDNDHDNSWNYKLPLIQRIKFLYSPKGFAYNEYLYYIKTFFPQHYITEASKLWIRTLIPWVWNKLKQ